MFRGTQTYRVSALWMQRSGPPPPPRSPTHFGLHPRRVHRARWLAGATLPLAFIYNQIPCIPATDARLNFYPPECVHAPELARVRARARARTRTRERERTRATISQIEMPDRDGKMKLYV